MADIDKFDAIILRHIQREGRATSVQLSSLINLSAPQCYRRVQRLEQNGVIRGYRAELDPAALGLNVSAFVSLSVSRDQIHRIRDFESVIRTFPEIIECHTISGDFDYLLKVVATDLKALSTFLTDRLMQVPGVAGVRSMVCLEEIKPPSPLPVLD